MSSFVKYFFLFSAAIASLQDRIAVDRFIYEKPHCSSVNECRGRNGCNGSILYNRNGKIELSNYPNFFNCRWEIRGGVNSKIWVKIESAGNSFGIENHRFCGFDRLNLQNYDGSKKFGRICSSTKGAEIPYNGMNQLEYNTAANFEPTKIKSSAFRNGVTLDSSQLVVAFDADNQNTGAGFVLHYQIIGDIDDLIEGELTDIGDTLEAGLLYLTRNVNEQRKEPIEKRIRKLFALFSKKMSQCRNGDMTGELVNFSSAGFEEENLTKVHDEWFNIFQASFEKCDLPIMKKAGSFAETSWPRRINSVMNALQKHI